MLDDDSDEASSASGVSAPTVGAGNPNYASPNKAKKRKKKSKGSSSSSGFSLDKTYRYENIIESDWPKIHLRMCLITYLNMKYCLLVADIFY